MSTPPEPISTPDVSVSPVEVDDVAMRPSRVEAFSDGVFAVAVTLLILNIQVPHLSSADGADVLVSHLIAQWPTYAGYFTTFLTLGALWIEHHRLFGLMRQVDETFQIANVLFLIFVVAAPFTTALLTEYMTQTDKARVGVVIYGAAWVLMGATLSLMWRYMRRAALLRPILTTAQLNAITMRLLAGTLSGSVAIGLAFINPYISIGIYFIVAVSYLRRLAHLFR